MVSSGGRIAVLEGVLSFLLPRSRAAFCRLARQAGATSGYFDLLAATMSDPAVAAGAAAGGQGGGAGAAGASSADRPGAGTTAATTDVRKRTVLPSTLQNVRAPGQPQLELPSDAYLDREEEELNRRVDAHVEQLVDGMKDLVQLAQVSYFRLSVRSCACRSGATLRECMRMRPAGVSWPEGPFPFSFLLSSTLSSGFCSQNMLAD